MSADHDKTDIWINETDPLITGDVIKWIDIIWSDKKYGKGKAKKHIIRGKQEIIGQIKQIDQGLISIKVISAEITEDNSGRTLNTHQPEDIIKKKIQTLHKRQTQRLKWTDESAREIIIKNS